MGLSTTERMADYKTIRQQCGNDDSVDRDKCVIVLQYAWLKDELTYSSVQSVAEGLFQAGTGANGFMHIGHYERITECRRRRKAVNLLLKHVLYGPPETYSLFLKLLKRSNDEHIEERLYETEPTERDLKDFAALYLSSLGKGRRPNSEDDRCTFRKDEFEVLSYFLNDEITLETTADCLLSKLHFSIREHTNIYNCPLADEQRVVCLLRTMEKCSYKILKPFEEALIKHGMRHVISHILHDQQKIPNTDKDEGEILDTRLLTMDTIMERRIIEAIQTEPMDLRFNAVTELSFDVEEVNNGSVVIHLRPVSKESWNILQHKCHSGEIKNFISKVYQNKIYDMLGEGRYEIDVIIYREDNPMPSLGKDSAAEKNAVVYLKDKSAARQDESIKVTPRANKKNQNDLFINRHYEFLCEEMGVSKRLLAYLKEQGVLTQDIQDKILQNTSRAAKVHSLLTQVSEKGASAIETLRSYIEKTERVLFEEMMVEENKRNQVEKTITSVQVKDEETKRSTELFFSTTAVLVAKKYDCADEGNKCCSKRVSWKVTCVKLINPICFFKTNNLGEAIRTKMTGDNNACKEIAYGSPAIHKADVVIDSATTNKNINTESDQLLPENRTNIKNAHNGAFKIDYYVRGQSSVTYVSGSRNESQDTSPEDKIKNAPVWNVADETNDNKSGNYDSSTQLNSPDNTDSSIQVESPDDVYDHTEHKMPVKTFGDVAQVDQTRRFKTEGIPRRYARESNVKELLQGTPKTKALEAIAKFVPMRYWNTPLNCLAYSTIKDISGRLDYNDESNKPCQNYLTSLCKAIRLNTDFVKYLQKSNILLKTAEALTMWIVHPESSGPKPTIGNFCKLIHCDLDRADIFTDLQEKIVEDAERWETARKKASTDIPEADDLSWQLTRHDVVMGTKTYYTCCLFYADEDVGMAARITNFFQAVCKDKEPIFFRPQFDLKIGKNVYETAAKVIEERCNGKVVFILSDYFYASEVCRLAVKFVDKNNSGADDGNFVPFYLSNKYNNAPKELKSITGVRWGRIQFRYHSWGQLIHCLFKKTKTTNESELDEIQEQANDELLKNSALWLDDAPYDTDTNAHYPTSPNNKYSDDTTNIYRPFNNDKSMDAVDADQNLEGRRRRRRRLMSLARNIVHRLAM